MTLTTSQKELNIMPELTEDELEQLKVVTQVDFPIRGSYVKIFTPEKNNLSDKMEYSLSCLVPKEATKTIADLRQAQKIAFKLGVSKGFWKAGKMPSGFKQPLRDGDKVGGVALGGLPDGTEAGDKEEYNNHFFFNARNTRQVVVKDEKNRNIIDNDNAIVSGDYIRVVVVAYPYATKSKGISFSLNGIQLVRKGEPLGASGPSSSAVGNDFGEIPMAKNMESADAELDDMFAG